MVKSDKNRNGIIGVLNRTREYNAELGNYQEHFMNQNFDFAVKLSNGRIPIPRTVAQENDFNGRLPEDARDWIRENIKE